MAELSIAPPWFTYMDEIKALFDQDPDVQVDINEDEHIVKLYVEGQEKQEAIERVLLKTKDFGGVEVRTIVYPANEMAEERAIDIFKKAFKGNPVVKGFQDGDPSQPFSFDYVIFSKDVVQFANDNTADYCGNTTMLFEAVARDVFPNWGIFFCTENINTEG